MTDTEPVRTTETLEGENSVSKNPFEVFQSEEDYLSWDKYIEQLDSIDLSEANRKRARESLLYLRKMLGENFLRDNKEKGHPIIFPYLVNAALRAKLLMIRLAEEMKALEGANNFDDLLKRVKHSTNCGEAISVLTSAYKFLQTGFTVSFEPVVDIPNSVGIVRPKRPDFFITDDETNEEIFVEISRSMTGAKQVLTSHTYHTIFWVTLKMMQDDPEFDILSSSKHVLPYAKIHRGLDEEELKDVINQIEELVKLVRVTGQFQELTILDVIEVGISPSHDHGAVKRWAAERQMKERVESPPIDTDEVRRAKIKLHDKVKQIPHDKVGIIIIQTNQTLLFPAFDMRIVIAELADELRKYPNLLGAVLSFEFLGSGKEESIAIDLGRHVVISKVREDWSTEQSVLILNEACALPVCATTLENVRRAFIEY